MTVPSPLSRIGRRGPDLNVPDRVRDDFSGPLMCDAIFKSDQERREFMDEAQRSNINGRRMGRQSFVAIIRLTGSRQMRSDTSCDSFEALDKS